MRKQFCCLRASGIQIGHGLLFHVLVEGFHDDTVGKEKRFIYRERFATIGVVVLFSLDK